MDRTWSAAQYAPMNKTMAQMIIELRQALGGINQEELAERLDVTQPTVSRWERGVQPDGDSIAKLAKLDPSKNAAKWLGIQSPTLGNAHVSENAQRELPETSQGSVTFLRETDSTWPKDLKILGFVKAGLVGFFPDNGEALDMTHRPPGLSGVRNAYAVIVNDESMVPVYKPGWVIWAHPWRRPEQGDDVIIQTADGQAFVKTLVRRAGKQIICKQWNPEKELRFEEGAVTIHLVVGTGRDP